MSNNGTTKSATLTEQRSAKLRILVVEDNPVNQLLTTNVLKKQGYTPDLAENGKVAVDMLKEHDYDIILMDIQMPEMDGHEATKIIRNMMGRKKNIPIIAVTSSKKRGEAEKCIKTGMDDFIYKPFDPEQLQQKIKALIH